MTSQDHHALLEEYNDDMRERQNLIIENEQMREALERCEWWFSTHPEGRAMRDVCRAALIRNHSNLPAKCEARRCRAALDFYLPRQCGRLTRNGSGVCSHCARYERVPEYDENGALLATRNQRDSGPNPKPGNETVEKRVSNADCAAQHRP